MQKKDHYLIPILEWASKKSDGFSHAAVISSFDLNNWQRQQIDRFFQNALTNYQTSRSSNYTEFETIFYLIHGGSNYMDESSRYVLTMDALFKFYDYSELKFARETAASAWRMAMYALMVAIVAAFFQLMSVIIQLLSKS